MVVEKDFIQTEAGFIPKDWDAKKLGEISDVIGGGTPSTAVNKYWEGEINWFTPTEVGYEKYLFESNRKLTQAGLINSSARIHQPGTILMTSRAGIGDLGILKVEAATNQGFQSLVPNTTINNEFLYYLMLTKKNVLLQNASGSTFLEISPSKVKSIYLAIPPLPEQAAIATALSDMDELIAQTEKLIEKKKAIKQGVMQELLRPKEGWVTKYLPEVCWFQEGPGVRKHQFRLNGVKLLNGTNIQDGKLDLENTDKFISHDEAFGWYSHFLVDEFDVLIACSGVSIEKFHEKVTIAESYHLPLCMNTSTMRFKVNKDKLDQSYFIQFLKSKRFKEQISGKATGSAQLNFGPSHVNMVEIDLPELNVQKEIGQILNDMEIEISVMELKLQKLKYQKQGMMQALLTGKTRLIKN
jgi:type I restriction enzyme S subunit